MVKSELIKNLHTKLKQQSITGRAPSKSSDINAAHYLCCNDLGDAIFENGK